jgi:hypothetical protein
MGALAPGPEPGAAPKSTSVRARLSGFPMRRPEPSLPFMERIDRVTTLRDGCVTLDVVKAVAEARCRHGRLSSMEPP